MEADEVERPFRRSPAPGPSSVASGQDRHFETGVRKHVGEAGNHRTYRTTGPHAGTRHRGRRHRGQCRLPPDQARHHGCHPHRARRIDGRNHVARGGSRVPAQVVAQPHQAGNLLGTAVRRTRRRDGTGDRLADSRIHLGGGRRGALGGDPARRHDGDHRRRRNGDHRLRSRARALSASQHERPCRCPVHPSRRSHLSGGHHDVAGQGCEGARCPDHRGSGGH